MKTLNKLFIAAIATMAMTACNNEIGEQQVNNSGIINFRMGIGTPSSSRITMEDNSYAATFAANDEVGVFVKGNNSYVNVKYTTKDGTNWDGGPINAPADEAFSYTFYAYHPYQESNNDARNITTTVATNQETEGYIKNDFLISTATTSNTTVDLPFDHALSLVEVRLTGTGAKEGAVVSMLDVATAATIDLTTETEPTVTTTGEKNNTVIMDALSGVSMKYRAIVPEQEIQANTPIFKIEVNNKTYNASFTSNVKFEKGKYLAMFITIGEEEGPAEIEITTGATINDWTEGDGGDVSVEEVPIILPIKEGDVLTEVIKTFNLSSDTWVKFIDAEGYNDVTKFEIMTDDNTTWGNYASLEYTSINGNTYASNSYYKAAISYYHASPLDATKTSIYKISMKIKTELSQSATADGELVSAGASKLVITCRTSDNKSSFAASTNQTYTATTVSKTPTNNNWMDFTIYINLAQKSTTVGTVQTDTSNDNYDEEKDWKETSDTDYSKFDLRFYTNNNASSTQQKVVSKIYISDLVMEPYIVE